MLFNFFRFILSKVFFFRTPFVTNKFNESTELLKGSSKPTKLSNKCNFLHPNILPRFLLLTLMSCARAALVPLIWVPNSSTSLSVKLANEYRTALLKAYNTLSIRSKPFFLTALRTLRFIKRKVSGLETG